MSNVQRVEATAPIPTILETLDRDGCIIIQNVLSAGQLTQLKAELAPHFSKVGVCQGDFFGYLTKRLSGLIAKSLVCQEISTHPTILGVMDKFLSPTGEEYQLNLTQAISIGPGEPEQIIHPDDPMFPFSHPGTEAMINCMWAVDDFNLENGATHVTPGSHKWPKDRVPKPSEIVQGTMPAGSVLIYFGSLLHGGGANRTSVPRCGVVISYCLGWLKQAENSYLVMPPSKAAGLPERLQRLLGYFVHKPNLGCVDGQDPILLLQGKDLSNLEFKEFLPEAVKPLLSEHRSRVAKVA